jgi:hypothetical protein
VADRRYEGSRRTWRGTGGSIDFACRRLAQYLNGYNLRLASDNIAEYAMTFIFSFAEGFAEK